MHVEWEPEWRDINAETPEVGEWVQVKYRRVDSRRRHPVPLLGPVVAMVYEHPYLPRPALLFDSRGLGFPSEPRKVVCWRRRVEIDENYEDISEPVDFKKLLDVPVREEEMA